MSSYSSPSSSPPPSPSRRRLRACARRCERGCCAVATYFPLAFVYSVTTWAVWVEGTIGLGRTNAKHYTSSVKASSAFGVFLYFLLNTCYTVAVFKDPGSPSDSKSLKSSSTRNGKYSILPTTEPDSEPNGSVTEHHSHDASIQNITVSSRGGSRFCKKCHNPKPDRAHHCSTCKRCVLKMDHHCPWLATCLGLHNYKPFVLFLIYTSIFCWVCLGSSGWWMWDNLFSSNQYLDEYAPINIIMLCVVSGIIGLVLTGFTAWHLWLCIRGQTTIECLEKTRYLSGVRSRVERNRIDNMHATHNRSSSNDFTDRVKRAGGQLLEFHANAVPGASRYEEGEEHTSPAPSLRSNPQHQIRMEFEPSSYQDHPEDPSIDTPAVRALRRSYHQSQHPQSQSSYEHDRETSRYEEYLDDRDSEKLPNAFDLGWRRNLQHLFGTNPWLWGLPVCNTTGNGWRWEVSEKWIRAKEEMENRKAERERQQHPWQNRDQELGGLRGGMGYDGSHDEASFVSQDHQFGRQSPHHQPSHHQPSQTGDEDVYGHSAVSMQTLESRGNTSSQRGRGNERAWGGRYRKDVDRSGDDGEEASFEVSSDEEGHNEEQTPRKERRAVQRGWSRDWD